MKKCILSVSTEEARELPVYCTVLLEQMGSSLVMWRGWDINANQYFLCLMPGRREFEPYFLYNA